MKASDGWICWPVCLQRPGRSSQHANINPWISPAPRLNSVLVVQFSCSCCSVTQSSPTLCNPMVCSTKCLPIRHQLPKLAQTQVHQVGDANHLILCQPLLLLPSIFPSISIFSNESFLRIRWPKYWSFSISPSN